MYFLSLAYPSLVIIQDGKNWHFKCIAALFNLVISKVIDGFFSVRIPHPAKESISEYILCSDLNCWENPFSQFHVHVF